MRFPIRAGIGVLLAGATACQDVDKAVPVGPSAPTTAALQSAIEQPLTIDVELVAEGLTSPIQIVSAYDQTRRVFIIDQAGHIRIVTGDGVLHRTPFRDVRSRM